MQVRLRDLDEVAEDLVVADAEAPDASARPLALLHLGEEGLAVLEQRAQGVEFFRVAFTNHARVVAAPRQVVVDGGADAPEHALTHRERAERRTETRCLTLEQSAHARHCFEAARFGAALS